MTHPTNDLHIHIHSTHARTTPPRANTKPHTQNCGAPEPHPPPPPVVSRPARTVSSTGPPSLYHRACTHARTHAPSPVLARLTPRRRSRPRSRATHRSRETPHRRTGPAPPRPRGPGPAVTCGHVRRRGVNQAALSRARHTCSEGTSSLAQSHHTARVRAPAHPQLPALNHITRRACVHPRTRSCRRVTRRRSDGPPTPGIDVRGPASDAGNAFARSHDATAAGSTSCDMLCLSRTIGAYLAPCHRSCRQPAAALAGAAPSAPLRRWRRHPQRCAGADVQCGGDGRGRGGTACAPWRRHTVRSRCQIQHSLCRIGAAPRRRDCPPDTNAAQRTR